MSPASKFIAASIFLFCLLIMLPLVTLAQRASEETTRIRTDLVLIDVLVMDRAGHPVRGIGADKFQLFIDNEKRMIESFNSEESSISFGIIYDMHPTTADRNSAVIDSLRDFKRRLPPDDDIFLAGFNMKGLQAFDFIPTLEQLEKHMADPATRRVKSLYDAVDFAADRIQTSRHQKRILLIISDSADHGSNSSFSKIRAKLMELQAEVYAIIVEPSEQVGYEDLSHQRPSGAGSTTDASQFDRAALAGIAARTGGAAFFSRSESSLRLLNIYQQIANEIRSHYTLGFYPESVDRRTHKVRVKLRGVPGIKDMVLTYRSTYQARSDR